MLPEGLLAERMRRGSDVFCPKVYSARIPFPITIANEKTITTILGCFYEGLNEAIFGGEKLPRRKGMNVIPDGTDVSRNRHLEVKAVGHTRRVMLKDKQIEGYRNLQLSNYPNENPKLYMPVYRYGMRGACEHFMLRPSDHVFRYLAENTRFMIGLDFSVIDAIHRAGYKGHHLASRNYGRKGKPATHLSSVLIDLFFSNPEEALKEFELEIKDYRIRHHILSKGLVINGVQIQPFPMVLIKSTGEYHLHFIKQLRKRVKT